MRRQEIDWRHPWIAGALLALDQGIADIPSHFKDGIDMREHAESPIGLGFVAIQVYIDGTVADLAQLYLGQASDRAGQAHQREKLTAANSKVVKDAEITYVGAIWAAANYFKHYRVRSDWNGGPLGLQKQTICALAKLGISKTTEQPCVEVLQRLQGDDWQLSPLLDIAGKWREAWISRLKTPVT